MNINIKQLLIDGKPVIDSDHNVLYLKGFILAGFHEEAGDGADFDFEDIKNLKPYISPEMMEIEKLKKQLAEKDKIIAELEKK